MEIELKREANEGVWQLIVGGTQYPVGVCITKAYQVMQIIKEAPRCNMELNGHDLWVCFGGHGRSEACEWEMLMRNATGEGQHGTGELEKEAREKITWDELENGPFGGTYRSNPSEPLDPPAIVPFPVELSIEYKGLNPLKPILKLTNKDLGIDDGLKDAFEGKDCPPARFPVSDEQPEGRTCKVVKDDPNSRLVEVTRSTTQGLLKFKKGNGVTVTTGPDTTVTVEYTEEMKEIIEYIKDATLDAVDTGNVEMVERGGKLLAKLKKR